MRLGSTLLISATVILSTEISTAALAQTSIQRSASVTPGKPGRIAVLAALKPNCSAGPAPEVRIVTSPKHGALIIGSGKLKTGRLKQCPNLEAPVRIVMYQASPQFQGTDLVSYEVANAAGKIQTHSVTITVNPTVAPSQDSATVEP